jgi:GNAT superfamily N-acetyltransferase
VRSWQAAYAGLMPEDFLARLSVETRTAVWAGVLGENTGRLLLLEAPEPAGFAAFGPDTGLLYALYLLPEVWGRGLGRLLHAEVVRELAASGLAEAVLWVLATNERAKAFYAREGWAPDGGSQTEDFGGVTLEELRFSRPLP